MSDLLFCSLCAQNLARENILDHVEKIHVGTRAEFPFELSCGNCEYRISEINRFDMIEHCFRTKHSFLNVQLNWITFLEGETSRLRMVIGSGVELLEENQSDKQIITDQRSKSQIFSDDFSNDSGSDGFAGYGSDSNVTTPLVSVGSMEDTEHQEHRLPRPEDQIVNNKTNSVHKEKHGQAKSPANPRSFDAEFSPEIDLRTQFFEEISTSSLRIPLASSSPVAGYPLFGDNRSNNQIATAPMLALPAGPYHSFESYDESDSDGRTDNLKYEADEISFSAVLKKENMIHEEHSVSSSEEDNETNLVPTDTFGHEVYLEDPEKSLDFELLSDIDYPARSFQPAVLKKENMNHEEHLVLSSEEDNETSFLAVLKKENMKHEEHSVSSSEEDNETNLVLTDTFEHEVYLEEPEKSFDFELLSDIEYPPTSEVEKDELNFSRPLGNYELKLVNPTQQCAVPKDVQHSPTRKESIHLKCHVCLNEISTGKFMRHKIPLISHAIVHGALLFFKCQECNHQSRNLFSARRHLKNKRCAPGALRGTINEYKRCALRFQLSRCFPGIDFESLLSSSKYIGNSKKKGAQVLKKCSGKDAEIVPGINEPIQILEKNRLNKEITADPMQMFSGSSSPVAGVQLLEEIRSEEQISTDQMLTRLVGSHPNNELNEESDYMKDATVKTSSLAAAKKKEGMKNKEHSLPSMVEDNETNFILKYEFGQEIYLEDPEKSLEIELLSKIEYPATSEVKKHDLRFSRPSGNCDLKLVNPTQQYAMPKDVQQCPTKTMREYPETPKNIYQKCHACFEEISTENENMMPEIPLISHATFHAKLMFFQCQECNHESRNLSTARRHLKNKRCAPGALRGTINEDKRCALRFQLSRCFPGIDFESLLSSSEYIGNSKKKEAQVLKKCSRKDAEIVPGINEPIQILEKNRLNKEITADPIHMFLGSPSPVAGVQLLEENRLEDQISTHQMLTRSAASHSNNKLNEDSDYMKDATVETSSLAIVKKENLKHEEHSLPIMEEDTISTDQMLTRPSGTHPKSFSFEKRSHPAGKWDCTMCSKKGKDTRSAFVHTMYHSGLKPYKCKNCLRRFTTHMDFQTHIKSRKCGKEGRDEDLQLIFPSDDRDRVRVLLNRAFPRINWDKKLKSLAGSVL